MPYTLFSQAATGSSLTADATAYTMGVQFSVSQSSYALTGIWFYSASGAGVLPQTIALYAVSGTSLVHSESASWSGAAGSGWVHAAFSAPPSLTSGASYKACVLQNTAANWYSVTSQYWDNGAGGGGLTNGPLSAPNNVGGDGGQDTFASSPSLSYPASSFLAGNYWVDPEVAIPAAASSGLRGLAASSLMRRRRRRSRGCWGGVVPASGLPSFTIGLLTAFSAPGAAILGLFDETTLPILDEANTFILNEDGS